MTGRAAEETEATRGSASLALSQRATSKVDTLSRGGDPFVSRPAVGSSLRYARSRDPDTTPGAAIRHAIKQDWLVALPRPGSGRECLTVRDGRRLAMCHGKYKAAGETDHAEVCDRLLGLGLPAVLDVDWIDGP